MTAAARTAGELGGPGRFACPSATVPGRVYDVIWVGPDLADCACPGFTYRNRCKHVAAVERLVGAELESLLPARERAALALRRIAEELMCEETA